MWMNKDDEKKKESPFNLKTILEIDTPQSEPSKNELGLDNKDDLEFDSNKFDLDSYSRMDKNSEIDLKQALDLLKSLKPNDELIDAIKLIEGVLKREW